MTWNARCMKVTMSIDQIWLRQRNLTFLTLIQWANSSFFQWNFSNAAVTSLLRHLLIFIRPESNHCCLPLSLTDSPTHSICLVDLIEVTLTFEDSNPKLVEIVTVADVDVQKRVEDSLMQLWKLKFGHKVKFLFRSWAQSLVKVCVRTYDMTSRSYIGN